MLVIKGLPGWPEPGSIYELKINFEGLDTAIAGFQLIALAADRPVGTFASADANVEIIGTSIRSTVPIRSNEDFSWSLEWRAPDEVAAPIIFYVAASAANDDGSPFGDTIHFRSYKLLPE